MAGWTKAWRKEVRSSIWDMPPLYHRVFLWLRYKVEHKTTLFPTRRRFGIWTNPGQILTSVRNIAEGVSWVEEGKDKTPNVKTIKGVLTWLEGEGAIKATSNTFGTFISLENWDTYQSQESKEVTPNGQPNGQPNGHTLRRGKKVKEKDLKEPLEGDAKKAKRFTPPSALEVSTYCEERKNGIVAQVFIDSYEAKGWMIGKNKMKDWKAAVRTWEGRQKDSQPKRGRKDARRNEEQPSGEAAEYANFWK